MGGSVVEDVIRFGDRQVGFLARGPDDGRAVLYLHGAPGSRREQYWVPDEVLDRFGVRLISVDRAGYGDTDPLAGDRPSRIRDFLAVLDHFSIGSAPVIGVSSGGSYSLTLAVIAPDRIDRVLLSSAQMPYDDPETISTLQSLERDEVEELRAGRSPQLVKSFEEAVVGLREDPLASLEPYLLTLSSREQALLKEPWFRSVLESDIREGVRRHAEGFLEDALSSVRPFEIDPASVACPVRAVHGDRDDLEPLPNLRRFLARLPDAQLFILEGMNHFGPLLYPDMLIGLAVGTK